MAARENQGLQIALIIFVILTIILIVTTWVAFRSYQDGQENIKSLTTKSKADSDKAREAADESAGFKAIIDPKLDKLPAVQEAAAKDFEAHGKGIAEADRNYRNLIDRMAKELSEANTRATEAMAQAKGFEDKIKADEVAAKAQFAKYTETIATITGEMKAEHDKFVKARDEMVKANAELTKKFDAKTKDFDKLQSESAARIGELTGENTKVKKLLTDINGEKLRKEKANEVPDGKITWVNQRSRTVWINLGSDDGLRRQTSFSVFGVDDANPVESDRKGKIEVTRLMDRHLAEARIVEDDLSNPLMPRDQIFSPVWEPGVAEHFALVGIMDIDGDGEDDREKIHDLISLNGGVIDEETDKNGKKTGQMTINTKYLVLGAEPKPGTTAEKDANIASWSDMQGEAQTLGVKMIRVKDFVDYMGYKGEDRTVNLGRKAKSTDFKARFPNGVQPTIPGSSAPKDPRRPQPTLKKS